MGYRIDYVPIEYGRSRFRRVLLSFLVGCLFWVVVYCCWPAGRNFIYRYLIPEKCVETFASDLEGGRNLLNRVGGFLQSYLWDR